MSIPLLLPAVWSALSACTALAPSIALDDVGLVSADLESTEVEIRFLVDNPLPGLTLYLDPGWMLVGAMPITENGQGRAAAMTTLPLPIFPGTAGWTFHLQAFVPDAAAPSLYSQSNLLSLRVGS